MSRRSPIVARDYERESGIPQLLADLGAEVAVRALTAGGCLLGESVAAERKQVLDLHSSIVRGRLWRQLGALRATARKTYLIVEGASLDDSPVSSRAIRGICVAVFDQGVRLIARASPLEWQRVPDVGTRRAAALDDALRAMHPR